VHKLIQAEGAARFRTHQLQPGPDTISHCGDQGSHGVRQLDFQWDSGSDAVPRCQPGTVVGTQRAREGQYLESVASDGEAMQGRLGARRRGRRSHGRCATRRRQRRRMGAVFGYRSGSRTATNMTPRSGDDTGLSTFDDPGAFKSGTKV